MRIVTLALCTTLIACGGSDHHASGPRTLSATDKKVSLGKATVAVNTFVQNLNKLGCIARNVTDERGKTVPAMICAFKMPGDKDAKSVDLVPRDDDTVDCFYSLDEWQSACKYAWDKANAAQ